MTTPIPTLPLPFPSLAWFERLAQHMNDNRQRQEQLGYVDCTVQFTVTDGGAHGAAWSVQVAFEEFTALGVREATAVDTPLADFELAADLRTWQRMIESIEAGHGRPDLDQTLNRLTHMGTPMQVQSDDPLRRDLYFRYNQSLQEFVNAAAHFRSRFPE